MHSKTPSITKAILADVEIWFKKHYIHLLLCDDMTWFADPAPKKKTPYMSHFCLHECVNKNTVTIVKLDQTEYFVIFLCCSGWTASIKAARQSERY